MEHRSCPSLQSTGGRYCLWVILCCFCISVCNLTDFPAAFGFGQIIGAIAAWASGEDLEMIRANDEKSKTIALVSNEFSLTLNRELTLSVMKYSSFPVLVSIWEHIERIIFSFTGWQRRSTSALKAFDQVIGYSPFHSISANLKVVTNPAWPSDLYETTSTKPSKLHIHNDSLASPSPFRPLRSKRNSRTRNWHYFIHTSTYSLGSRTRYLLSRSTCWRPRESTMASRYVNSGINSSAKISSERRNSLDRSCGCDVTSRCTWRRGCFGWDFYPWWRMNSPLRLSCGRIHFLKLKLDCYQQQPNLVPARQDCLPRSKPLPSLTLAERRVEKPRRDQTSRWFLRPIFERILFLHWNAVCTCPSSWLIEIKSHHVCFRVWTFVQWLT